MSKLVKILVAAAFVAAAMLNEFAAGAAETQHYTLKYQGIEREYWLYLPENYENAPLVFVLHGYGGHAENYMPSMVETAAKNGFAVCYPQGYKDTKGKNCWNVGYHFQEGLKTDDIGFLCKLAHKLQKTYGLSKENTFLAGMSNGGEMCYLLAYKNTGVFKALAPISGLTLEWMVRDLKPNGPIPIAEFHGTQDHTSEWCGDLENKGGWGAYLAVPVAVYDWVTYDKCTHEITTEFPLKTPESHKVILHKFVGGTDGCEVRLYEIIGGKHSHHTSDLNTTEEIWDFFSQYLK